ncbi:pyrroloquinoline quinone biosynthesis peptide chaperone PqqD [Kineosporia sp. J2-2]|uniref:Pyrroloquinoline quinone biosynthesis peptide chaperone PqqD n=1 Tax=Kineosporia corallincola TaxID=2835133 RepID=A0ABS5TRN1_9ACTN|nr:pyrroloquinoline quinone biosynthesis peptide chaperone PqqD [Kineosporia corallincola]MBT0773459.1 pyrroloquinoline quinone biosynthesis peptide chaperone PqqD [Kineosporia corallincola]
MTATALVSALDRPRPARHVRLTWSRARRAPVLLLPETVVVLNGSGVEIFRLCDGTRTVRQIVDELGTRYRGVREDEVRRFLTGLVARRCVELAR